MLGIRDPLRQSSVALDHVVPSDCSTDLVRFARLIAQPKRTTRVMIYRWLRVEIASLVLFTGLSAAWAESPTLQQGVKALQAGNAREAAKLFTTDLESPDRSPEERARAFYFRAKAYLAIKQPGLAVVDAGVALWLKKLSPKETADAERLKAEAQRSAEFDPGLPAVMPVTINALPPAETHAATPASVEPSPPPTPEPAPQKPPSPEQAAVLPPPAVRQPPPPWSTAKINSEKLPPPPVVPEPPAKPITAWITSTPIAALPSPVAQQIETGSVARPVQSSAPDASGATPPPQQSAQEQVVTSWTQPAVTQVAQPSTSAATKSFLPGLAGLGSLFEPEPSPMLAEVDQANDFQRRYYEKIRQHNRDPQNRNAAQSSNVTQASEGAPAAPGPR